MFRFVVFRALRMETSIRDASVENLSNNATNTANIPSTPQSAQICRKLQTHQLKILINLQSVFVFGNLLQILIDFTVENVFSIRKSAKVALKLACK